MTRVITIGARPHLAALIFITGALLLAGCATPQRLEEPRTRPHGVHAVLVAEALVGTPYRYGGSRPEEGFDCSGLVHYSYGRTGVSVPRTVRDLRDHTQPVRPRELAAGDLVFFRIGRKRNAHVGLYTGDGAFIHAPSSGSRVRKDQLDDPYWKKRYERAGRIPDQN
ncbi:MAG: C40 family peptidase [Pseudomonadota bacterium]|nr:C40 family peptidase [Pseudomonadota bacterium]